MFIDRCNSTNTLLKELIANGQWPTAENYLYTGFQTAGRGQTGNGWESEANKNLLCSIVVEKYFRAHQQISKEECPFFLNVAVSVALHRVVAETIWLTTLETEADKALTIKWPNDLYYGDKKLAGILIESAITGQEMTHAIVGIGLNVHQTEWHSDAPNPTSLKLVCEAITGEPEEWDIADLMDALYKELEHVLDEPHSLTWWYYKNHLYRKEGFWPFVEREVSLAPTMNAKANARANANAFLAHIQDVLPTGEIVLQDQQGKTHTYHFKQVRYVV